MNETCKKVRNRLLLGEDGANTLSHAAQCSACRDIQAMIRVLEAEGAAMRQTDLSLEAARETRRQVARVMEERRARKIPAWPAWVFNPWVRAYAAAFLVAVGLTAAAVKSRLTQTFPAEAAPELAAGIERLEERVTAFKTRYREASSRPNFEKRSDKLQTRIEICALQIKNELAGIADIP